MNKRPQSSVIGAAGEHLVLSHLLRLGYIAGKTPDFTKDYDFHQKLDNDGIGTDLTFEFLSTDESIVQFNIHQPPNDAIRCYLKGNMDNDEVPFSKMKQIENYLNDVSGSNQGGTQPKSKNTSSSNNPSF